MTAANFAWTVIVIVGAAFAVLALAALAHRIGKPRPVPAAVSVTDAKAAPTANRAADSGRRDQRHPAV